jgi:hypothetical protein
MANYFLPLISVIIGAALTLFSSWLISRIRQKDSIKNKMIDQFFEVRKEIVDVISSLANIKSNKNISDEDFENYSLSVSKLFFKNYDLLPSAVSQAMLTLHACIENGDGKYFKIQNSKVLPMTQVETKEFITNSPLIKNTKVFGLIALNSTDPNVRRNYAIKIHAQHVINQLYIHSSTEFFLNLYKKHEKEFPFLET